MHIFEEEKRWDGIFLGGHPWSWCSVSLGHSLCWAHLAGSRHKVLLQISPIFATHCMQAQRARQPFQTKLLNPSNLLEASTHFCIVQIPSSDIHHMRTMQLKHTRWFTPAREAKKDPKAVQIKTDADLCKKQLKLKQRPICEKNSSN